MGDKEQLEQLIRQEVEAGASSASLWFKIASGLAVCCFGLVMIFVVEERSDRKELRTELSQIRTDQASIKARLGNLERVVYRK